MQAVKTHPGWQKAMVPEALRIVNAEVSSGNEKLVEDAVNQGAIDICVSAMRTAVRELFLFSLFSLSFSLFRSSFFPTFFCLHFARLPNFFLFSRSIFPFQYFFKNSYIFANIFRSLASRLTASCCVFFVCSSFLVLSSTRDATSFRRRRIVVR